MRILHTYCLNYNWGDYALGIGVKNLLRRFLDVDLIAEANLQGTVFDDYYVREVVNKNYDLLVIGGGGIIHGAHWPNGWFWLIDEEQIDAIEIPFIVYGVGYNYFEDEEGIPPRGIRHLKKTIENAAHFSVRNDGSLGRFQQQIGLDVPVVPDPGFHVDLDRTYANDANGPYVVVQLADDKPIHRFGSEEGRARFVADMRAVVRRLADTYDVVLAPHVHADVVLCEQVAAGIPRARVWDFASFAFDRCADVMGVYQSAEFVLAMRGHGQIVPLAFGTPVISLENHPKHAGLMRELGLDDFNVDIRADGLQERLLDTIAHLERTRPDYVGKVGEINASLWSSTERAFRGIRQALDRDRRHAGASADSGRG